MTERNAASSPQPAQHPELRRLRAALSANPRFRLELMAAISAKLREFQANIADEVFAGLTLAHASEIEASVKVSVDPTPTTPPIVDPK